MRGNEQQSLKCRLAPPSPHEVHYAVFRRLLGEPSPNPRISGVIEMNLLSSRRDFLRTTAFAGAALLGPRLAFSQKKKSVLLFTKSSGFEHAVIKVTSGK